jgi:hypothetical protein
MGNESYQCYMLPVDYNDRQKKQTYIFFDFECTQDDRIQCQQGYQSDDNEKCIHCKSPRCDFDIHVFGTIGYNSWFHTVLVQIL